MVLKIVKANHKSGEKPLSIAFEVEGFVVEHTEAGYRLACFDKEYVIKAKDKPEVGIVVIVSGMYEDGVWEGKSFAEDTFEVTI